jgi:hypothetical protein
MSIFQGEPVCDTGFTHTALPVKYRQVYGMAFGREAVPNEGEVI